ncbi:phosphotransferase [Paractinoplanes ferrugineus]|uniref:phosphotransferase n=1 Tax=Paractinoplanes ferrugineus TaxID=113564 RepID=UPI001944AB30|nr:phosphotransferase [Actinoplanes ferrugineus]
MTGRKVVSSRLLSGGYSNENTLLEMSDGGRLVLRRYLGKNRCAVETALATRLRGIVPVPEVVAASPADGLLLSMFVEGGPVTADAGRSVGETLARIGSVSFGQPGFFGDETLTPDGFEPIGGLDAFVERCLREGNAAGHLTPAEQKALLRYATQVTPELDALRGSDRLVHADYNPKNMLAAAGTIVAVLDWEFAFSSSPLFDVANLMRDPRPPGFTDDFLRGFRDGGGVLPANWRSLSAALDLYSLADFLTRPVEHRYFGKAVTKIRELVR